ncbi:hypothetical protein HDV57DRAFT_56152 [Trichoderma longibrachiatum]
MVKATPCPTKAEWVLAPGKKEPTRLWETRPCIRQFVVTLTAPDNRQHPGSTAEQLARLTGDHRAAPSTQCPSVLVAGIRIVVCSSSPFVFLFFFFFFFFFFLSQHPCPRYRHCSLPRGPVSMEAANHAYKVSSALCKFSRYVTKSPRVGVNDKQV